MKPWTGLKVCNDPNYLEPELETKSDAVIRDVQGHFDPEKVQIRSFETIRSVNRQKRCVANGTSRTMHSSHLPNKNGLSRARDIVPYVKVGGKWQPTWRNLYGDDGRSVWDLITSSAKAHGLERVYFKGKNGKYVDGPHVQLPK